MTDTSHYCDRSIYMMRWKYCLVVTEEGYYAEMDRLGVHRQEQGSPTGASAAAVTFVPREKNSAKEDVAIVCILEWEQRSGIEIAGLLVHEAVHVWQKEIRHIGEEHPSDEFMAYGIQWIAQELLEQFWRQVIWKAEGNVEKRRRDRRVGGGQLGSLHQVREGSEFRGCPDPHEEGDGEARVDLGGPAQGPNLHDVWRAPKLHEEI